MLSYEFLFDIALILMSTKLLGLLTKQIKLPQVVGALLAGLLLGPACLNILHETDFIIQLAELGVIVLMFTAGLETDINELKKSGKASLIIAILGMIIPLAGGFILASIFNKGGISDASALPFLQNIFIGIILTATSVSITVETLKELGKLSTRAGNAILGAAIIDDILGVIALTVVTSATDPNVSIAVVLIKIVLFFIVGGLAGFLFSKFMETSMRRSKMDLRRFVILSFVFCLILSYCAEHFFGVADITGAFMAGLFLSNAPRKHYIMNRFETTAYMLLSPIFFASIGIKVVIPEMTPALITFSIALVIIAILTKVLGCALGAKMCKYSTTEAIQIGTGMVSRGEVALIVASKGASLGLMGSIFFGPIVIMVVITTVITPILLKIVFSNKEQETNCVPVYKKTTA
ncbi:MAG: cation:proton antiporter [Turicibacter sp.]|jgi:Kef-type K+ transport system membrane component KefB|uniref:Sodium:proton antiporter n=1 Tax=Turicibacter faecis TaxID=2963365 RepID=A0ABN6Z8U5_9FIRM|nr:MULTISPECIES: cation:proton antiporter [unclassified Turicibacter]MCI8701082.1 cation:proton antiporter [Turicibacter sp.]BEH89931.1 sodium:proton antiporter [Turicibacter sp. TC023]MCU7203662.1 cation:proton antiporter [Turicibacter sp. TA25]MCU7208985.1 cation:proton antiporter [Turicibacter sp. 1E2]NCE79170.1 cation:proton antiporter [Turicibacter sp. TS3]